MKEADPKYIELRAAFDDARARHDRPAAIAAWDALTKYVIERDGPRKTRGFASRAGQRQYRERQAERAEAAARQADRRWK